METTNPAVTTVTAQNNSLPATTGGAFLLAKTDKYVEEKPVYVANNEDFFNEPKKLDLTGEKALVCTIQGKTVCIVLDNANDIPEYAEKIMWQHIASKMKIKRLNGRPIAKITLMTVGGTDNIFGLKLPKLDPKWDNSIDFDSCCREMCKPFYLKPIEDQLKMYFNIKITTEATTTTKA